MDVFEIIAKNLPVSDVIKLCSTSKENMMMMHNLLRHRRDDILKKKSQLRWCCVCNSRVTVDRYYVLFICTCQGNCYPYYHMQCIGKEINEKGCAIERCPSCHRRKPVVFCDNTS